MNCNFCGAEIKEGDKWFNWWSREEERLYKICLKCSEKIKNL